MLRKFCLRTQKPKIPPLHSVPFNHIDAVEVASEAHSAWKALVEGCTVITLTMNFSFTWSLTVFIDALWWDL